MTAYYNEHDSKTAAWLRELIIAGAIPDGEVDQRSIEDIVPGDLRGFSQCHFFAGIGGWAEALTIAEWPNDQPVWTGSCPCQSFSAAGQRKGFADERHLWPAWFHLIEQCRPPIVFGEQVDAAIKHGWLDLVQTDMEAVDYAYAAAVIPAAGLGAPHRRHRLWFVADADARRWPRERGSCETGTSEPSATSGMEHTDMPGQHERAPSGQQPIRNEHRAGTGSVEHATLEQERISRFARKQRKTNGFWTDADWIPCSDGKWRPIEPGVFPLAHGVQARMDKLRGFGNAIVPEVGAAFITAFLEARELCI